MLLLPGNMEECFEFGWRAFDLAERLQTPIFVLSDLDLGMNLWMSEPFAYPDKPMDRGKVLSADETERASRLRSLWGCGWRRHRPAHAARHGVSVGGVLHARQRPQRAGAVHRAPRRVAGEHAAAGAQARLRAHARPSAGS